MACQKQYFMTEKSITVGSCLTIEQETPQHLQEISQGHLQQRPGTLSLSLPFDFSSWFSDILCGLANGKWQAGQELLPPPCRALRELGPIAGRGLLLSLGVSTDQKPIVHSNQIYPEYMLGEVSSDWN